jgi:hypothetical protein
LTTSNSLDPKARGFDNLEMYPIERLRGKHAAVEVIAWAKKLRYFYFMGEILSGQMELYEELEMRLDFDGRDDLIRLLGALGLLRYAVGEAPKSYKVGEESRISDHPDLIEPGWCVVAGVKCVASVGGWFIDVNCFDGYQVLEAQVQEALRLEAHVDALGLQSRVNRGIAKHSNCVSAENFPREFAAAREAST